MEIKREYSYTNLGRQVKFGLISVLRPHLGRSIFA